MTQTILFSGPAGDRAGKYWSAVMGRYLCPSQGGGGIGHSIGHRLGQRLDHGELQAGLQWAVPLNHSFRSRRRLRPSRLPCQPLLLEFKGKRGGSTSCTPAAGPWSSVLCGLGICPALCSRTWCLPFGDSALMRAP